MKVNINIPPVYQRGVGVISKIGEFCQKQVKRVIILGGRQGIGAVQEQLVASLESANLEIAGIEWYGGECTWANIQTLSQTVNEKKAELVIAVGGGKVMDTGKAVAYQSNVPCITVPTIAATCAAFTPLSIIHDDQGRYVENTPESACPIGIIVDTQVILEAPAKWFYAGMGDTLAKLYELRATTSKIPMTSRTIGGISNGKICYQVIEEFGAQAKLAIEDGQISSAFEYVIDAIILYAGMSSILGGEQCRGAAAHSVYFGFTNIPAAHDAGHGLLVGFGNLVLLALEGRSDDELLTEIKLAQDCGVPIRLSEIAELTEADLKLVAEVASQANDMKNMPLEVTPELVIQAIRRVDELSCQHF